MAKKKAKVLGGLFIRKRYLNPEKIKIIKKDISRKSLREKFPIVSKLGIIHKVVHNGILIKEFHNKDRAIKFKKKLIKDIKKMKGGKKK